MSRAYKKAFADFDYEKVPANNRKGYRVRRVYRGTYTRWALEKPDFGRRRLSALIGVAASAAAFFAAVTRPSMVNIIPLSGVPGALTMIPLIFAFLGMVQLFTSKNSMATRMFVSRRRYLICGGFCTAAMGVLSAVLSVIVCFRIGVVAALIDWTAAALYLFCGLGALVGALAFFRIRTVEEKTQTSDVPSADARL